MRALHWLFLVGAYMIVAVCIYAPSLKGPWQYDDHSQILDKEVLLVHSAPKFFINTFKIFPEANGRLTNRDAVRATFRLNWDWRGNSPLGYRWVNLLIHVANSVLVAALVWLLFAYNNYKSYKNYNFYIPVLAGLLFLVHPINSQAIAYIAQRFTSLTTMFYLGAVVCYILYNRFNSYKYYIAALVSAALAFSSKEISITLPVVLLLVCWFTIHYNNYKNYNRYKLCLLLLPFFFLSLKIPLQLFWSSFNINDNFKFEKIATRPQTISEAFSMKQTAVDLSRRDYFFTQINVVRTYQRLFFWPAGQTIDWDYPLTTDPDFTTILTLVTHISLITLGMFLFIGRKISVIARFVANRGNLAAQPDRHDPSGLTMTAGLRLIGMGVLWFYITLLPESSVIPIIDVIYEHRAYLPMVGICLAFAGLVNWTVYNYYKFYNHYKNYILTAGFLWLLLLSLAAFNRAYVWGDQIRLWADAAAKSPHKARTNKNYGVVLAAAGQYEEGIKYLTKAIELKPDDADYHSNLGTAYLRSGKYPQAAEQFQKAYDLYLKDYPWLSNPPDPSNPSNPSGSKERQQLAQYINDFGVANVQMNKGTEALEAFQKALEIDSELYSARLGLGAAYNVIDKPKEAIKIFSQLVKEFPDQTDALNNLAVMHEKTENWPEALTALIKLQILQPDYPNIKERIAKVESKLYSDGP